MHPQRTDEILNTFCLRSIIKTYKIYSFVLKRLKDYHHYSIQSYLKHQPEGEFYLPFFEKIDSIADIIRERGYLWRSPNEMDDSIKLLVG